MCAPSWKRRPTETLKALIVISMLHFYEISSHIPSPESPVWQHPAGQVWVPRERLGSHHRGCQRSHIQAAGSGCNSAPQCCSGSQAPLGAGGEYHYDSSRAPEQLFLGHVAHPLSTFSCLFTVFVCRMLRREVFQLLMFYRGMTHTAGLVGMLISTTP